MTEDINNATAVANLAAAGLTPKRIGEDGKPFMVVPESYKLQDIEHTLKRPLRPTNSINVGTEQGFIKAFFRFVESRPANTEPAVYIDRKTGNIVAVLDDHGRGDQLAGWRQQRIIWTPALSPEWQAWKSNDKTKMNQETFAEFLEDNAIDIYEPNGAQLLAIVTDLKVRRDAEFSAATRLQDGQTRITYNENLTASTGKSELVIPDSFIVGIPVFLNGPLFKLKARFRYRLPAGPNQRIQFSYELDRAHKVYETAWNEMVARLEAALEKVTFIEGAA